MKKYLIILSLHLFILSVKHTEAQKIPTISIEAAIGNKRSLNLSDIAREIEYVRLKSPVKLNQGYNYPRVIVGNRLIVVKSDYYQKIFVFDREGNFLHAFGEVGRAPNEIARFGTYWDLSPNGKFLAVTDRSFLKLFAIDGKFISSCKLPAGYGLKFYFADENNIVVYRPKTYLLREGSQIFFYDLNLNLSDSLFWTQSSGPRQPGANFPADDFWRMQNKIYFRPCDQDTLFRIIPGAPLKPSYVFRFGNLKAPERWMPRAEFDTYRNVNSLAETKKLLIVNLYGPMRKDFRDYFYETLIYEKATGQYYTLERFQYSADVPTEFVGIKDDLDGLGYYSDLFIDNSMEVSFLESNALKKQIEMDTLRQNQLKNRDHIDKLLELIGTSDESFPLLRIVHFDKPARQKPGSDLELLKHEYRDNSPFKPVRTNHQWKDANGLSDQTYDPSDDSFWLSKQNQDSIEHRSRTGEKLPGSFAVDKKKGIEAITCCTYDNSFWMADIVSDSAFHYDKSGKDLGGGFKFDSDEILGIVYDPTDSTLWMVESKGCRLLHYSTDGKKLGEYDVLQAACNDGRGLAYDPRDNSIWIVNTHPNKMIHVNKKGEELPGSFYFDSSLSLPDGVALDHKGFEFWIANWGMAL